MTKVDVKRRGRRVALALGFTALSITLIAPMASVAGPRTKLMSKNSSGVPGNNTSSYPDVNNAGDKVVFASSASNLVLGDTNGKEDVFTRAGSSTRRVSVSKFDAQGDDRSRFPSITPDGKWVAFDSEAENLVSGDSNAKRDIFLVKRSTGKVFLVSQKKNGAQGNGHVSGFDVTPDGRYVVFETSANNLTANDTNAADDILRWDRTTKKLKLVTRKGTQGKQANGDSSGPVVSANGRFVAFESSASNLVKHDTNNATDIFVKDLKTGAIERVNLRSKSLSGSRQAKNGESFSQAMTPDGRFIVFASDATNLVKGDTNGATDVFIHDRLKDTTRRITLRKDGSQISEGGFGADISASGRYVTFRSASGQLVGGDTNGKKDIFLRDRKATKKKNRVKRISVDSSGTEGIWASDRASISPNGRWVVFETRSAFVAGDTNDATDIYRRGPLN